MTISAGARADALLLWEYLKVGHEPRPCSVAVALGSHDLGVADTAADCYRRGQVPLIVMTGATSTTTAARMPRGEAAHYRERALELGVPDTAILLEPRARNTGENIAFSRALLEGAGIEAGAVLLVSKPYEERRAYATARRLWPSAEFSCASAQLTYDRYVATIQDERLVVDMMVGALQRLLRYSDLGFLIAQRVPEAVVQAGERLYGRGFTSRALTAKAGPGGPRTSP